jgi:hypothetical protein
MLREATTVNRGSGRHSEFAAAEINLNEDSARAYLQTVVARSRSAGRNAWK